MRLRHGASARRTGHAGTFNTVQHTVVVQLLDSARMSPRSGQARHLRATQRTVWPRGNRRSRSFRGGLVFSVGLDKGLIQSAHSVFRVRS